MQSTLQQCAERLARRTLWSTTQREMMHHCQTMSCAASQSAKRLLTHFCSESALWRPQRAAVHLTSLTSTRML